MDRILIAHTVDLDTGQINTTHGQSVRQAVRGNRFAICWQVTLLNAGRPASMNGCLCCVKAVRADGATVPVQGSISGNMLKAILSGECFAVVGKLKCYFDVMDSTGDVIMTASNMELDVIMGQTDEVVDPGDTFPDFSVLVAALTMTHIDCAGIVAVTKDNTGQYTVEYDSGDTYVISIGGDTMTITTE